MSNTNEKWESEWADYMKRKNEQDRKPAPKPAVAENYSAKEWYDSWSEWKDEVLRSGCDTQPAGRGMTRAFDMTGDTIGVWDEKAGEGWLDFSGNSADDLEEAKAHNTLHKVTWMSNSANKAEHFDSEEKAKARVNQLEKSGQYHSIKHTPPKKQGVEEGIGDTIKKGIKSVKRGMQGWGDGVTPAGIKDRASKYTDDEVSGLSKGYDDLRKTRATLPTSTDVPKHSPAGLQKRVVDREMKKRGLGEASILGEALDMTMKEWGDTERYADQDWHHQQAAAPSALKRGKYCLTRDNPPVRGQGFMCFDKEVDAIAAWKQLSSNNGVKIVRENADFADDGTPLTESNNLFVNPLVEYGGRDEWDTNSQGYQDREQGRMDGYKREFKAREMDQELRHEERNNYEVTIDGKGWKVFYDRSRANNIARAIQQKYPNKQVSVRVTGAAVNESAPIASTKPRNFVAKHMKSGGAGAHTDKKRAEKQGQVKHKGKLRD